MLTIITLISSQGLFHLQILLQAAIFIIFIILFIGREKQIKNPLISIILFRSIPFSATIVTTLIQSMAMFGGLLLIPMYLQHVHEFSPSYSGLLVLPLSITMMIMSPIAGQLSSKKDIRTLVIIGMVMIMISLILFSTLKLESRYLLLALALATMGFGIGISNTPLSANLVNLVSQAQMGMASGVFNMTRYLGGVIGSTIFGAFMQYRLNYYTVSMQQADPLSANSAKLAMVAAFHDVYLLIAAVTVLGVIVAYYTNPSTTRN